MQAEVDDMPIWGCDILDMRKTLIYSVITLAVMIGSIYSVFELGSSLSPPDQIGITIAAFVAITVIINLFESKYGERILSKKMDIDRDLRQLDSPGE